MQALQEQKPATKKSELIEIPLSQKVNYCIDQMSKF